MDPDELAALVGPVARGERRVREGEPARQRRGVDADPALALPRQRGPLAADEDRVRLLARRRLAGRVHGALARRAPAARPRAPLPPLRLPERHARPPERPERPRARRAVAPDLRRRRAVGDPHPQRRAADRVAALQGVLVADDAEVRDPRLPPARLLLRARRADDGGRPRARPARHDPRGSGGGTTSRRRRSSSSPCSSSRARSSRCSRCGSTRRRTRSCAEARRQAVSSPRCTSRQTRCKHAVSRGLTDGPTAWPSGLPTAFR